MVWIVGSSLLLVIISALAWRHRCWLKNRKRATSILHWIETTLGGSINASELIWDSASDFRVSLRTCPDSLYANGSVSVTLCPKHSLASWAKWAHTNSEETVRFDADFENAPRTSLDLHTIRYLAKTRQPRSFAPEGWHLQRTTPTIITTRNDWKSDVTGILATILQMEERCFIDLRLSMSSPHYSVTVPLCAIAPESAGRFETVSAIHELAAEASSFHGLNS